MPHRMLSCCVAAVMLGGCASIPETISTPVPGPEITEVRASPEAHVGKKVRWGGTISNVANLEDGTDVTVVARRLTRSGEPQGDERSTGRFLVTTGRFLDPEEYETGRRITVVGTVTGVRPSKIGEYVYDYPVVRAQHLYLWAEYASRDPYPYPYYGWPHYWGPYYRPYHWPFHHHRYGHFHDPWW